MKFYPILSLRLAAFILLLLPLMVSAQSWQWSRQLGTAGSDYAHDIVTDASGNVYTTGSFTGTLNFGGTTLTSSGEDMFVAKYTAAGNLIWVVTTGGAGSAVGNRIGVDQWGNVYVGGIYNGAFTFGTTNLSGSYDLFYTKLSPSGTIKWVRNYASTSIIWLNDMKVSPNGKIHACGEFTGTFVIGGITLGASPAYSNAYFMRLDSAGLPHWAVSSGGPYDETAYGLAIDNQGNTYATGEHFCNGGNPTYIGGQPVACSGNYSALFLVKFDSTGVGLWARSAQASGNMNTIGTAVAVDALGNPYVVGWTTANTTNINFPGLPPFSNSSYRSFVVKCNSFGFGVWTTASTGYKHEDILVDGANFWLGGERIERRDTAGGALLSNVYAANLYVESICLDPTGRVGVSGYFNGFMTLNTSYNAFGSNDGVIAKFGSACGVSGNVTPSGNVSICGGQPTTLSASGSGGTGPYVYNWSTGATTSSISVSTAGSFTVSVTDIGGCTGTSTVNVSTNNTPSTPSITPAGPTTFCTGGSVTLTSSASSGNVWSNGATTSSITVSTAGSYTVYAVANGCTSATSTPVVVAVNTTPAVPVITPNGPTTFCQGGSVTLVSNTGSGNVWSTGATTNSITASTAGSYTVMAVANGCTSATSSPVVVTVANTPSTPVITPSGPTTFCSGGSVTLSSSTPVGNVWSNGATTQSISVSTAGTYTVMEVVGGCSSSTSAPVMVTVNASPSTPTVSAAGPTTFCQGGSVVLISSAGSGNVWSNGSTSQSITVNSSGTYTVMEVANGCSSSTSVPVVVTVNPPVPTPSITASGATTFCDGSSVVLSSSAASGNQWSNGSTSQFITVTTSGVYTVYQVAAGCTSAVSSPTIVTVTPIPATPTITPSGATTFCEGGSVTLLSSSGSGNQWSNGSTSTTISVNATGVFTVSVSANGCTSAASSPVQVIVNPNPAAPTITQVGNTLTAIPAASSYQWFFNGALISGATAQTHVTTQSGTYTVQITDANGCTSVQSSTYLFTGRADELNALVSIYPNPSQGLVNLDFSAAGLEECELTLRSYTGSLIWERSVTGITSSPTLAVDLGDIADGVYFLQLNSEKGLATFKVTVQR